jgi:UDPglucose 6-dehydrogenase
MSAPIVGYAGLTHLGICSAVGAASRGWQVVGFAEDPELVELVGNGRLPIVEPGLDAAFTAHRRNLSFTADARDLATCDIVYIAVDVPTDDKGKSDLSAIEAMLERVSPCLNAQAVLVMLSQVPPGFTRGVSFDSRRRYYQVETLIFGRALERATKPERFIVGCAEPMAPLPEAYRAFLAGFGCPVLPMRYESAELAKIAINCFLVASQYTCRVGGGHRCRLGRDCASIETRCAHRTLSLLDAGARHRGRKSRTRPRNGDEACAVAS